MGLEGRERGEGGPEGLADPLEHRHGGTSSGWANSAWA